MQNLEKTGIKPVVIDEIKALAQVYGIQKVILFGSRARGDYHRASDIDLAVEGGRITDFIIEEGGRITDFIIEVKDSTSTLLDFDVVDLANTQPGKFLESIKREGIILYEKI